MSAVWVIAREAFVLLRRDKVFVPAIVVSVAVAIFANLASEWAVEEFYKILFDVGAAGFRLTGGLVAVFWGTKAVTDSRQEGALEVQLAAPVSRPAWLIGKYLGMAMALALLAVTMLASFQAFMLLNDFGTLTKDQLLAFSLLVLEWLVLAALATLFATFCRQAVAMFATLSLWVAGLGSAVVYRTLAPESNAAMKSVVGGIARIWDLQQFNVVDGAIPPPGTPYATFPAAADLVWRGAYGFILIAILMTIGAVVIARRDATT